MFGYSLLRVIAFLLDIYVWAIIASAVLSWGFLPPSNKLVRILRMITEPVLNPCRRLLMRVLPYNWRRFDFSPVAAILLIQLVIFILNIIAYPLR